MDNNKKKSNGLGVGVGAAIGLAISLAMTSNNERNSQTMALGLAIGTAMGAIFDVIYTKKNKGFQQHIIIAAFVAYLLELLLIRFFGFFS
jgi:small basic protein